MATSSGGGLAVILFLKLRKLPILPCIPFPSRLHWLLALQSAVLGASSTEETIVERCHTFHGRRFPPGTEAIPTVLLDARLDHANRCSFLLPVHPVQLYATLVWLGFFVVLVSFKSGPARTDLIYSMVCLFAGRWPIRGAIFSRRLSARAWPALSHATHQPLFIAMGVGVWLLQRNKQPGFDPASTGYLSQQGELKPTF